MCLIVEIQNRKVQFVVNIDFEAFDINLIQFSDLVYNWLSIYSLFVTKLGKLNSFMHPASGSVYSFNSFPTKDPKGEML